MKTALSALGVGIQILSAVLAYLYVSQQLDSGEEKLRFWQFRLHKLRMAMVLGIMVISQIIFFKFFVFGETGFLRALMNAEVFIWLAVLAIIDGKLKIIPNRMILVGLGFWLVLVLLDIFVAQTRWETVILYSAIGGLITGGVLMVIALLVKSALGMGDVKMFFVLGLLYGLSDVYYILLLSLVMMAVVSLVLLLLKKVTAKTAVPMAPFVVLGFLVFLFCGF